MCKASFYSSMLAVIALGVSATAHGAFVDYYNAAGATLVANWTFDDGTFDTFNNGGGGQWNYIHDVTGPGSDGSPFYQGDQAANNSYNHPTGGALNSNDQHYFYLYPDANTAGREVKNAVETGANGFSFYMRYRMDAATARYFHLLSSGLESADLLMDNNGGSLIMTVNGTGDMSAYNRVTSDITAADFVDGYHDILATYDASNGNIEVYLDGVNRGVIFADGVETGVAGNSLQFNLFTGSYGGGSVDAAGVPAAYNLIVDDIRVYDGVVTAVPEPVSLGIAGLAAVMLARRRIA